MQTEVLALSCYSDRDLNAELLSGVATVRSDIMSATIEFIETGLSLRDIQSGIRPALPSSDAPTETYRVKFASNAIYMAGNPQSQAELLEVIHFEPRTQGDNEWVVRYDRIERNDFFLVMSQLPHGQGILRSTVKLVKNIIIPLPT